MELVSDPHLRARTSQSYVFACSDRRLMALHLSSQPKFWEALVKVIERPDLLVNPLFETRLQRITHYPALNELLSKIFATAPAADWIALLTENDVPAAPVNDVPQVFDDPQVRHLDSFMTLNHPEMGAVTSIRRPVFRDSSRADQPQRPPPMLGEHTEQVLNEARIAAKPA